MNLRYLSKVRLSIFTILLATVPLAACSDGGESNTGGTGGGAAGGAGGSAVPKCLVDAPEALRTCAGAVNAAWASCYANDDGPCQAGNADVAAALSALESTVTTSCADNDFGVLSVDALVGRLQNSCKSEADSLAWRTFGGPQGAVWPELDAEGRGCLQAAHDAGAALMDGSLGTMNDCLASGDCDGASVDATVQGLVDTAANEISGQCSGLASLIAVSPSTYSDRARHQTQCMTATSHPDTSPLTLPCGPSNVDVMPPRGEYMQIVLDSEKWGTLCGDGTPFAFYVRLAPEGAPLDRILVGLQGGGVCALEADCVPRFESRLDGGNNLFNAMDDEPTSIGIASTDPEVSPFADWTKVYVPYCNQDVFAGGGVVETLGELDLPRYGAENMRAAVQVVRDITWGLMDEEGGAGFRPDEIIALFGGWSAGGYGALYNYHWFLDELQWPRTAAFPDASGALDNGQLFGVRALGVAKIPAWGAERNLPSYCFVGDCALGPVLYEAISPRLKQVPEQQMLIVSNPKDDTQRRDAFFRGEPDEEDFWNAEWINTMREKYCETKDLNGIQYYYTSVSDESLHVVTLRPELWAGAVDGEVMSDWFWRAVSEPDTIQDRVEEANFVTDIPGAAEYPCEVAP